MFLGAGAKERRRMKGFLAVHWYDGPVNELRVVDIQRVRV